jgi:predicted chitinase
MLDNLMAALGIGNPLIVTANKDTWLKPTLEDSTNPINLAKKRFSKGNSIAVYTHKIVGKHLSIQSIDLNKSGHWYLFLDDIDYEGKPKPVELLTFEQLDNIAIHTPLDKLRPLISPLNEAMDKYKINTPLRIAHFIAQVAHESDGFNTATEYASGAAYEGRTDLGNTQSGDGERYRGRGLIQITGRYNYTSISRGLGVDFVANPQLLATPQYSSLSAGWFWDREKLNQHADRDDVNTITRIINGGFNGLRDRKDYLYRAKIALGL